MMRALLRRKIRFKQSFKQRMSKIKSMALVHHGEGCGGKIKEHDMTALPPGGDELANDIS